MTASKMTTELIAISLAEHMTAISAKLTQAFVNLSDAQPGFPSSTPMASASSGPSVEPDGLNAVERLASRPDPARRDLDELHRLVAALVQPVDQLYALVDRWSYKRVTPATVDDGQAEWCVSCLRTQTFEPVYRMIDSVPLCWFCHDMQSRFHMRPSLALLDKHRRGRVRDKDRAIDVAAQRAARRTQQGAA